MKSVTSKKKSLIEEIMDKITEKHMEKLQYMVNKKTQDLLKKFQNTTNKKFEKTQIQLNELREDFENYKMKQRHLLKKVYMK
jgi:hypothetical protein